MKRILKVVYDFNNMSEEKNNNETFLNDEYIILLTNIHHKLIEFNVIPEVEEMISSIEFAELFNESLEPYQQIVKNQEYWDDGTIHCEITDFLEEKILLNVNEWGFREIDKNSILKLKDEGALSIIVHELTLKCITLISNYTIKRSAPLKAKMPLFYRHR